MDAIKMHYDTTHRSCANPRRGRGRKGEEAGEYFRMLSGCAVARTTTKCNLTVHESPHALHCKYGNPPSPPPRTAFRHHFPPHIFPRRV